MTQLYSTKPSGIEVQPKKETIQFLINFSKSLTFLKIKSKDSIELNLN